MGRIVKIGYVIGMVTIDKNNRDSNVELLRLLLMSMIVLTHLIVHGVFANGVGGKPWLFVYPIIDYHVACFIFISGYYGMSLKWNKLFQLLFKVFVYGVMTYFTASVIVYGLEWRNYIGYATVEKLSPFSFGGGLWFMRSYFFLMLVSSFVNTGVDAMDRKTFAWVIIVYSMALYFSGIDAHGFTAMLLIYLVGRFLRKYPVPFIERNALWFFIGTVALMVANVAFNVYVKNIGSFRLSTENSSPLIILAGASFFFLFKKIKLGNVAVINWLAAGVLGVYMLTDGYLQSLFNSGVLNITGENIVMLVLAALIVTVALSALCRCFDYLLLPIGQRLYNYTLSFIRKLRIIF